LEVTWKKITSSKHYEKNFFSTIFHGMFKCLRVMNFYD
jgi:hypothetical protein